MNEKEKQPLPPLPNMSDFCLNMPLYHSFPFDKTHTQALNDMEFYRGHLDCYCMYCKKPSVFHSVDTRYIVRDYGYYCDLDNYFFEYEFSCTRDDSHRIFFYFLIFNNTITKIGQYPSLADLATVEIQKYRKVLGPEHYPEFNRAVGLASHGIGIGSFVYLRRIFENLIEDAHKLEMASSGWNEELYQKGRMDDKISLLKHALPEFLVENKSLYSILSKGIHELTESECLSAFPITRLGIELILDEKLEKLERDRKIKKAKSDISELTQRLKSKDS
jgi:hypothetical protein